MALPVILGAVSAISQIAGPILGSLFGAEDRAKAQNALKQAQDEILSSGLPPDQSAPLIIEKLKAAGVYKPEMEEAIQQNASKLSEVKEDNSLRDAQTSALQLLQQRASTGLNPEDRAAFNQLRKEAQSAAEGKRQQIIQSMQQRGMAGSGAELAAQLSAAQAGDQALSEGGDRLAAAASQNALQALAQGSNLASNVRSQDFDVNSTRAKAEDELNRFNVQNQIARQQRNVGAQNQAQQINLDEAQRIQDANTRLNNEETLRQVAAARQAALDKQNKAQQVAGVYKDQANNYSGLAAGTEKNTNAIGSAIGGAAAAGFDYLTKEKNKNKV